MVEDENDPFTSYDPPVLDIVSLNYLHKSVATLNALVLRVVSRPELGGGSRLMLEVQPEDDKNIPVKTLYFMGSSTVRAGNHISAKVLRHREKKNNKKKKKIIFFFFFFFFTKRL